MLHMKPEAHIYLLLRTPNVEMRSTKIEGQIDQQMRTGEECHQTELKELPTSTAHQPGQG
jgi:hypothetical protein